MDPHLALTTAKILKAEPGGAWKSLTQRKWCPAKMNHWQRRGEAIDCAGILAKSAGYMLSGLVFKYLLLP